MSTSPQDAVVSDQARPGFRPGWPLLIAGCGLAGLGLVTYLAQVASRQLFTPWYMPAAAAVGVVLIGLSLWQSRSITRIVGLLFVLLLGAAEGAFILGTRLPAYTGPIAADQPFPAFATVRADGTPFTERDLKQDQNTVLVFFRGRW